MVLFSAPDETELFIYVGDIDEKYRHIVERAHGGYVNEGPTEDEQYGEALAWINEVTEDMTCVYSMSDGRKIPTDADLIIHVTM